jgi:hypothetical protein
MRSSRTPAARAAARAAGRNGLCVTTATAPESRSCRATSSTVYSGFAGDTVQPAQTTPSIATGMSIELGV